MNPVKRNLAITMGIAAAFAIGAARADDATSLRTENRVDHNAAVTGESHVGSSISQEFTGFAGSSANAGSLVTGLRRGTPVTLTASSATGPSSVTFTPPTRPMGNGNVEISLALAQQRLASLGVTQPTPEQVRTALVGGTITTGSGATARTVTLPGVLTQRSQGMGWGNIARSQGTNLGHVISAAKRGNQPGGTTTAVNHPGRIVTASDETVSERQEQRLRNEHRIRGRERAMEDRNEPRFEQRERLRVRGIENGVEHRFEQRVEVRERGINGGIERRFEQRIEQRAVDNGRAAPANNSPGTGIVTAAGTPAAASGAVRPGREHGRGHENGQTVAGMTASGKTASSGIVNGSGAAVSTQMNVRGGGDHGRSHGRAR